MYFTGRTKQMVGEFNQIYAQLTWNFKHEQGHTYSDGKEIYYVAGMFGDGQVVSFQMRPKACLSNAVTSEVSPMPFLEEF